MEPFKTLTALAAPLDRTNVDTDQIIPKQFLSALSAPAMASFFSSTGVALPQAIPILNSSLTTRAIRAPKYSSPVRTSPAVPAVSTLHGH